MIELKKAHFDGKTEMYSDSWLGPKESLTMPEETRTVLKWSGLITTDIPCTWKLAILCEVNTSEIVLSR